MRPVLLKEVIEHLKVKKGQRYIDATIGGGGHARALLEKGAYVLGIDADQEAIDYVSKNLESRIQNSELTLVKGNFRDLEQIARLKNFRRLTEFYLTWEFLPIKSIRPSEDSVS